MSNVASYDGTGIESPISTEEVYSQKFDQTVPVGKWIALYDPDEHSGDPTRASLIAIFSSRLLIPNLQEYVDAHTVLNACKSSKHTLDANLWGQDSLYQSLRCVLSISSTTLRGGILLNTWLSIWGPRAQHLIAQQQSLSYKAYWEFCIQWLTSLYDCCDTIADADQVVVGKQQQQQQQGRPGFSFLLVWF